MQNVFQDCAERLTHRRQPLPVIALDTLPPDSTLAISVDLNNGFAKRGALSSTRVGALIPATAAFAGRCAAHGISLVALTDCHDQYSPEFEGFPPHCLRGTDEPLVVEELRGFVARTVEKNSTNGFYRLLEEGLIDPYRQFIITGCCTDICILQLACAVKTWFNEQNRPCRVIVPVSLVDTYDAPEHNAQLYHAMAQNLMAYAGVELAAEIR